MSQNPSHCSTWQVVQNEAFHMKRALDAKNLREALKHSAVMISELRTPVTVCPAPCSNRLPPATPEPPPRPPLRLSRPVRQAPSPSCAGLEELSPKNYYQLYMAVLDELVHMEQFFNEMRTSGTYA